MNDRFANFVTKFRSLVLVLIAALTLLSGFWALKAEIATNFLDFFPENHPNVELYKKFSKFGGAQIVTWMIEVKEGDIFNLKTLAKIQGITRAIHKLPGVNHMQVLSLASHRVTYAEAVAGGLDSLPFMHPKIPKDAAGVALLKARVKSNSDKLRQFVSPDGRSATFIAGFNEFSLDYEDLFWQVKQLNEEFEDTNHKIAVGGEPIVRGYGYYYLPRIQLLLFISAAVMMVILYLCLGHFTFWWLPAIPAALTLLWGLGFGGYMGYTLDPVMIVVPFLLLARSLSHGIQWMQRYYDQVDNGTDRTEACRLTTAAMVGPGLLAIVTDMAGIAFISYCGIPTLANIATVGSVWMAGSFVAVFACQPALLCLFPVARRRKAASEQLGFLDRVGSRLSTVPTTPGFLRTAILVAAGFVVVIGLLSGLHADIGYSEPGTPLYRPNAKINQDLRAIGKNYPVDEGWIILTTPAYPDPQSALSPASLYFADRIRFELLNDPAVVQVVSFASTVIKPFNHMFRYGYPAFHKIPETPQATGNLWYLYAMGTAPGEMGMYFSDARASDTNIRLLLRDHTYDTLKRIEERAANLTENLRVFYGLDKVKVLLLGGPAGLYAAANDVLFRLDAMNITFVLGVVFVFCGIAFRSVVAGFLFLVACVLANFVAFIVMKLQGLGVTIDSIPVISLGIGLGVDYGIYTVERIRDEVRAGRSLDDAILVALKSTGRGVGITVAVMVGGIFPWTFSPVLFHSQMSTLLVILMITNMIAGVWILPSFISMSRSKFIRRFAMSSSDGSGISTGT